MTLLAEEQRVCRVLGAGTSELTVVTAATSARAAAVVIVSQLDSHRRAAVGAVLAVDLAGVAVFYAGNAFAFRADRFRFPGTFLGDSMSTASTSLLEAFSHQAAS